MSGPRKEIEGIAQRHRGHGLACNHCVNDLLKLFNSHTARARIDELDKMVKEWGYGKYPSDDPRYSLDWEGWAEYRKKQLTNPTGEKDD